MSFTLQPLRGIPRVPRPTPTAVEAQGDVYLASQRFRHLCASGSQPEIKELLQHWANPTDTFQGWGALAQAAKNGPISPLEYLAGCGFSLLDNAYDSVPDAASEYATRTGDTATLEFLLQHGWDPTTRVGSDKSSLYLVLSSKVILRGFLTHGSDPNAWCPYAVTATTEAARCASLSVLKLLVSHGGRVFFTDAVAQAVSGHVHEFPGRLEVMEYILEMGAPIDAYRYLYSGAEAPSLIDLFGVETGLQLAARGGKKDMVELLLRKGADKTIKGGFRTRGEIAMEIASANGFVDIATLLK